MKKNWKNIVAKLILTSFIIPIAYLIYKIILSPISNTENVEGMRVRSDYILMLLQCLLGIVAIILPSAISKKNKIVIPPNMYLVYMLFLYSAIVLGEMKNYYYKIPYWDTILHACSGAMLGALGFSFISLLNKEENIHFQLSPIFVSMFAFCFAIMLGVVWEIYEYAFDGILGLNMQKFALENKMQLVGREALNDTMQDLIVDCIGALLMSVIGYISLKHKKGWIEKLLIKKAKER